MVEIESNQIEYRDTPSQRAQNSRCADTATIRWRIVAPDGKQLNRHGDSLSHAKTIVDEHIAELCQKIRAHLTEGDN